MRRYFVVSIPFVLLACSSSDTNGVGATPDASRADVTAPDTGRAPSEGDAGVPDAVADAVPDVDQHDVHPACPAAWTAAPTVDPSIAVPSDGGTVILRASATGTQDYTCSPIAVDGGTSYAWVFVGPQADLADCTSTKIGTHFASDGGATRPEWATSVDGTYVIGKKVAANTPDGGASLLPWLLLQAVSTSGSGLLARTAFIQRVNATGGAAPTTLCDATNTGASQKVPYTADYYFSGQP